MQKKKSANHNNSSTTGVERRQFLNLTANIAGGMICLPIAKALGATRKDGNKYLVSVSEPASCIIPPSPFPLPPVRQSITKYQKMGDYAKAIGKLKSAGLYQAFVDVHMVYCGDNSTTKIHGTWFLL